MTEGKAAHRRRFSDGMLVNGLILRELDIKPGWTVVDAGCGNGYMTMLFSDRVGPEGTVYGLDLNIDVFKSTFPGPLPANVSIMGVRHDRAYPPCRRLRRSRVHLHGPPFDTTKPGARPCP